MLCIVLCYADGMEKIGLSILRVTKSDLGR